MDLRTLPDEVNLLYIEDDSSIIELITEQLNSMPHTKFNVVAKSTLKDGLEYIDAECKFEDECEIDAVLLDLVLPNSTGIKTFLKVQEKVGFLPIVIISAHEDIACKCVSLGAQDYLVKPDIPPGLLIRSLKYSIHRHSTERKMKNVIMTSSLGYHMYELINDSLIFTGYNPASNKILNVDNSQFVGKEINEAFPGLDSDIEKNYRLALKGTPWVNHKVEYGNKQIPTAIFRVNAYKTAENFLTVTFEDVTEKIKTAKALDEALSQYRNLVEVTGASIFGMDFINQKFTYVNDVMCNLLGYNREELLDMWPSDYLTPQSKKEFNDRVEALKLGEFVHNNVEYECITKGGDIVWVLVTTSYPDLNEPIIIANAVAIDITEKVMAKKALDKKEIEVFSHLEKKIHDWKKEIIIKNVEKEDRLQLIDAEIQHMTSSNNIEVI